ncbi:FkbM family methyltransferase [Pseudomonas fluorescens]|uniref:Methyltransferase FkbM domain-containing protein n=1 Tax=Pseudomonas fluorescens TaxID=294 RepID=A0A5E7LGW1_PSEFL|nr:FkbM family methyltransferase [Pseudomonas fluorescens]VVP12571.1 hypothetical protein PS880_03395 [Pseudomonas fluorescens]
MKTIKRESIDVGIALSSASKRMQSGCGFLAKGSQLVDLPVDSQPVAEESYVRRITIKAKIKRALRFIAKHIYRCLKPLIKPIAFRIRQYLLVDVSEKSVNIAHQQQTTSEVLLSKLEALEHHVASISTAQRLAAEQIDRLSCAQQTYAKQEVPEVLISKLESLEHHAASISAAQRLAAEQIDQLSSAQQTYAKQEANKVLLSKLEALERHATSISAAQLLAAKQLDQLSCDQQIYAQQEVPQVLISKLESLEHHAASISTAQQLATNTVVQLSQAQKTYAPEELLQQIKRIEDYTYASARRVAVNCGPDEIMIKSVIGFVLCSATDHALIATLLEAGELEPGTRQLIKKILKPGDVYIDVGANIGIHMLAAAQAMQGSGTIIGFEPFGPTKALIDKTMWINGFSSITETHQLAVSNKSGSQPLNLGATSGHHSLFKLDTPAALAKPPVQVDLISLDEIIDPGQMIHLLKIDAEGAELDVIEGAKRLLKSNPQIKLIVELGLSHLERTGHSVEDWLEKFSELGFDYQVINANTGELETCSVEKLKTTESVNLFFSKAETAGLLETKHEH